MYRPLRFSPRLYWTCLAMFSSAFLVDLAHEWATRNVVDGHRAVEEGARAGLRIAVLERENASRHPFELYVSADDRARMAEILRRAYDHKNRTERR